ncbi:hypothetical protein GP486_001393 [Trichoglossum hirsutum]|uniref:Uncharacterized protein n=1 Tax=Trichoglossum hirsutum TaxID=265104 RepID=A0A9P8LG50_9PEZI|nr:hypothetical protein GP486_001393 [Trichoglossum hirsutum]
MSMSDLMPGIRAETLPLYPKRIKLLCHATHKLTYIHDHFCLHRYLFFHRSFKFGSLTDPVPVCIFTGVLFLSGLFLQQQTVRQFHAALATQKAIHSASPTASPSSLAPIPAATGAAYAQLVVEHHDVCSTIMLFSELDRSRSRFDKILMYPGPWGDVDRQDARSEKTKGLLKVAAERYNVILRPMEPIFGDPDDPISLNTHFFILQPNVTEFARRAEDPAFFNRNNHGHFRIQTAVYREDIKAFDSRDLPRSSAAATISNATYVTINSPPPEHHLTRSELLAHKSAPPQGETRNVWEGLYERYKNERMEVCGLGLETWDGSRSVSNGDREMDELKA